MVNYIHPTAILNHPYNMGDNIEIMEFVVIGAVPLTFDGFKRIKPKFGIDMWNNIFVGTHSRIMKGSIRDTLIKNNVIIGQNSNVGHDSIIHNNVRIMNNVAIDGFSEIGKWSVLGTAVKVRNRKKIGENSLIGMASNVISDIPDNVIAYGNPCKVIGANDGILKDLVKRFLL